jgi:hypothetical protein
MTINYRIYSNGGNGGAVDYSTPVATTAALTTILGPLGPSTDNTFVLRAFDTVSGLEEANTTARVRVVVDANGNDVSALPGSPHAVTLSPTPRGGCRVSWAYVPADDDGTPVGFHVYVGQTPASGPAPLLATVAYRIGCVGYSVLLPRPFATAAYVATVAGYNATGEGVGASLSTALPGPPTSAFDVEGLEIQLL